MNAPHYSRLPHRQGFTLIELLSVIAIIGVLAGILIPVVGRVRENGRKAVCGSNLRQNGLAMLQYASDHKGRVPAADSGSSIFSKSLIEGGYLPKSLATWTCPTHLANDPEAQAMVLAADPDKYPRSYAICGPMLAPYDNNPFAGRYDLGVTIASIVKPSDTVMLTDLHGYGPGVMRAVNGSYQGGATFERERMAAAAAKQASPWNTSYHADGARNFVFADGHVAFLSAQAANQDKYWMRAQ